MSKKEIRARLLVTLGWLVVINFFVWRWYLPFFKVALMMLGFWVGALIGTFLLEIDHFLYVLLIQPQEVTSQRIKRLIQQRRFKKALVLLTDTREERTRLPLHNALFQVGFFGVCFFVLTSTGSLFGAGLVMAMALQLLKDEFELLFKGREKYLRQWLFWPIKAEISLRNQKFFVILMLLAFVGLNFLFI